MGRNGTIFLIAGLVLALVMLQGNALAYCTGDDCDNDAYKTDLNNGGNGVCHLKVNYYKKGTLYNDEAGTYHTDYCISSSVLREYYIECMGVGKKDVTHYIDYACPSGYQCSDGACKSDPCEGVACNNYCGGGDVRYYNGYCSGGSCYYSSSYDCDNYDGYFCDSGNVRMFKNGYCSSGSCYTSISTVEDCDDRDVYGNWEYYCESGCVKRKRPYYDYYCSGGSCTYSTTWSYETLSCNGDSDYCDKKADYCGGCGHEEYDCDSDSECSGGLECKGGIFSIGDGCCYSDEFWDDGKNRCVDCYQDSHCPSDYCTSWSYSCTSTQVGRSRTCYDYYCTGSGSCSYTETPENEVVSENGDSDYCGKRNDHCPTGCSHGQYDCDSDSECSGSLECMGPVGGNLDGCCYSSEHWDDTNYRCVECTSDSHCPPDYYGGWVYYCSGDDRRRHREIHDYYCSAGSCTSGVYWTDDQSVETCYYGCSGNACNPSPIITFQGTVKYYDQHSGIYRVLPGVRVELWDKDMVDDNKMATGETNSLGRFRFDNIDTDSWDAGTGDAADIYVNVVMESPIAAVSEAWNPTIINHETGVYSDVLEDKDIAIDIGSSSSDWYHPESAAANVMDVIRSGYLFFKGYDPGWSVGQTFVELHNDETWICKFLRNIGIDDCSGAHFETGFKDEVHLYGYNIWRDDTIAHEYAHSVMYKTYGNKWPSHSKGSKEYSTITLTGVEETASGHLAFTESNRGFAIIEGWAEFMEAVNYGNNVQNPLSGSEIGYTWCYAGIDLNSDHEIDKHDTFHEGSYLEGNKWWMGEDAVCPPCNHSQCERIEQWKEDASNPNGNTGDIVEGAVASIFWDIYDSNNTDELNGEGISNGFSKLWSIVREDNPDDILDFWDRWFSATDGTPTNYGDLNKLAYIYEMHGIDKCPDNDGDGYDSSVCGGPDCNDGDSSIHPGVAEACDGKDNNCDGTVDNGGNALCSDGLHCNGQETCNGAGGCQAGTPADCSANNILVSECFYIPDSIDYTFDFYSFGSACDEDSDTCTLPPLGWRDSMTHTCDTSQCGAECETGSDCPAGYRCDTGSCTCKPLEGDVNRDCEVNIFDLAAVGLAYGSRPGDANWNPGADVTGDGIVNIFDLATVGLNYSKTC